MKISCSNFREYLNVLADIVPKKCKLPILQNVLIGSGAICANNLESALEIQMPEATDGVFLLPFSAVITLVKHVPYYETLTIEKVSKDVCKISWHDGNATFESKPVGDFPPVPSYVPEITGFLNGDILIPALLSAIKYCATDETRPVLTGVSLYLGDSLAVAGTDGFRLAYQYINMVYPATKTVILPTKSILQIRDLWKKRPLASGEGANIILPRKFQLGLITEPGKEKDANGDPIRSLTSIMIKYGDVTFWSRVITGSVPDHLKLVNSFKQSTAIKFNAEDVFYALQQIKSTASSGASVARFSWSGNQMKVAAKASESQIIESQLTIEPTESEGKIGINVFYLMDYLNGKSGTVSMGYEDPRSPAVFRYPGQPLVTIMPMMVKWQEDEETKADEETEQEENAGDASENDGETESTPETITEETQIPPEPGKNEPEDVVPVGTATQGTKTRKSQKSKKEQL